MSLRTRVTALVALAVAAAFLLASIAMFASTRRSLLSAVDAQLREAVAPVERAGEPGMGALRELLTSRAPGGRNQQVDRRGLRGPQGDPFRGVGLVQLVDSAGTVLAVLPEGSDELPVDAAQQAALDDVTSDITTVRTDDGAYRSVATGVGRGLAVQIARPIDDIEQGLSRLVAQLAVVSVLGVALAAIAGRVVADRILDPVRRLTTTAELIADTQELAHRAEVDGDDELARLAASLNRMLTALDTSRRAQQQLVADASHELRTPLTSLRTNVELLASSDRLGEQDRAAMRADVVDQIDEMTVLIGNLVDLARDGQAVEAVVDVRLDELVDEVVQRQQRLAPQADLRLHAEAVTVRGEPDRLRRAVANLVDNAVKYAGEHGPIEVAVNPAADGGGEVVVRDRGPGIPAGDRARVFDRFWRSATARAAPGSGLGLAIVDQVARSHGGSVDVVDASGGGAQFRLRLPPAAGTS